MGVYFLKGKEVTPAWTRLAETANIGDQKITVQAEVNWSVGDKFILASTADTTSFLETEELTITEISDDGTEISFAVRSTKTIQRSI